MTWLTAACRDCRFAVERWTASESATFECRFGPPARGRYTIYASSDEAKYPIVTQVTPACSQFKVRVEASR